MFPFSLQGVFELELPHIKDEEILHRIIRALEIERAKNIRYSGHWVRFRGGQFRAVRRGNRLSSITTGTITIERKNERRLRVHYYLAVWELFLIFTGVVVVLFGPIIWQEYSSNPRTVMLILGGMWFWLFGVSLMRVRLCFPWFLKDFISLHQ
ncbi:hypothetical protein [Acaryochloris marina]|uniref:Uncharacterized protein n=1 Tax=Acaryochloris marina (strain MBIC 11017) TaxID=329726 RepID=A8ZKF9_ACAM1|nr:hypothetical protein [Acaryochloris marina]ABW31659.1 hypothetical protein AM1_A0152 [Acaryochloris marina MBIC11017]